MTVEMLEQYAFENGHEQGVAEGAQQKAVETAKKLLADGKYTAEEISSLLQIPAETFAPVTM